MVQNPLKTVKIGKNGKIDEHDHDGQFRFSRHCLNTDNFVPPPHRKAFCQLAGQ